MKCEQHTLSKTLTELCVVKLVTVVIVLMMTVSWDGVMAQENVETPAATASVWTLSFEYREAPAKGSEKPPYDINFSLDSDGNYTARNNVAGAEKSEVTELTTEGQMKPGELDYVVTALESINLPAMAGKIMNIGYGIGPKPNWQGTLRFNDKTEVQFSSLRSANFPERTRVMNKLVTFVFDLKHITLNKVSEGKQ